MKNKIKHLLAALLLISLMSALTICACAEEAEVYVAKETEADNDESLFSKAYTEIAAYASEILCALTIAGSLVLAFAYKTGRRPLLKGTLMSIGNAVGKINDSTNESAKKSAELEGIIEDRLSATKEMLDGLTERISSLDASVKEKLASAENDKRMQSDIKTLIDTQIDMLYNIFMCAALPQYQKDAVGEKIAKMKEAMSEHASVH